MPLTAVLTQITPTPALGLPTFFELKLFNAGGTAVTATMAEPFVQLPAGTNQSLVTGAIGNVVARPALPLGSSSLLPSLPITVPANGNASIAFGVQFTAPIIGPGYQLTAVVACSDGTSAVPAAVSLSPSAFGPMALLSVIYTAAMGRFNDPNNSSLAAAAA